MDHDSPFLSFINACPTPWHVEAWLIEKAKSTTSISSVAVHPLDEAPQCVSGQKYLFHRGGLLVGIIMPENRRGADRIIGIASHTDSPCLKVKHQGVYSVEGMNCINCEIYGSPILASWIGRSLLISGKVWGEDRHGARVECIFPKKEGTLQDGFHCVIPHVAIHLDRGVNEQGLSVPKQDALSPIISLDGSISSLKEFIQIQCGTDLKRVSFADLSVVPGDRARFLMQGNDALLAPRLDNLISVWASFESFISAMPRSDGTALLYIFGNHEEIGSETSEGAYSRLIGDIVDELLGEGTTGIQKARKRARSLIISCDAAHGYHPHAGEKYDSRHKALLGRGVAVKINSQQRYSSPPAALAACLRALEDREISHQVFTSRNDIPCGTTMGPILSARLGISAIDIGAPVVGMHAAVELASLRDIESLRKSIDAIVQESKE